MRVLLLEHEPYRAFAHLRRELLVTSHCSNPLKGRSLREIRGGSVLVLGDLDDGGAVTAVDRRHRCNDAVAPRPHGGQVRRETPVGLGHGHVTARRLTGLTVAREDQAVRAYPSILSGPG